MLTCKQFVYTGLFMGMSILSIIKIICSISFRLGSYQRLKRFKIQHSSENLINASNVPQVNENVMQIDSEAEEIWVTTTV